MAVQLIETLGASRQHPEVPPGVYSAEATRWNKSLGTPHGDLIEALVKRYKEYPSHLEPPRHYTQDKARYAAGELGITPDAVSIISLPDKGSELLYQLARVWNSSNFYSLEQLYRSLGSQSREVFRNLPNFEATADRTEGDRSIPGVNFYNGLASVGLEDDYKHLKRQFNGMLENAPLAARVAYQLTGSRYRGLEMGAIFTAANDKRAMERVGIFEELAQEGTPVYGASVISGQTNLIVLAAA